MKKDKQPVFQLGSRILTNIDLARALREAKQIDEYLSQSELRSGGESTKVIKTTRTIEDLAKDNNLSLLDSKNRKLLIRQLTIIEEHAPVVHFSFPTEPSRQALNRIASWLREKINHYCLLQVGLEPQIGIGCIVRTDNKILDCSLKNRLKEKRELLKKELLDLAPKTTTEDTQPVTDEVVQ